MEQNKLENEFRNKLNQREINPSENSWDRLDAMLSVAEEIKPVRSYSWIYIAASIIGFAFFGSFFLNQSDKNVTIESNKVVIENNLKAEPIPNGITIVPLNPKSESTVVVSEMKKVNRNSRDANLIITNQVVQNSNSDSLIPILEKKLTNQKTEQLASSSTSDIIVEKMLASIQTTSKADNLKSTIKVNPNTLLSQVDGELELSFREKALNTITKKYKEAKEALVNRNNQ
jgi:hypothetical protein